MVVKKGANLYLSRDTLELMKQRDKANGKRYRCLRNEVTRLVRRDKQASNVATLAKSNNNPKVLRHLADEALGKDRPSLPSTLVNAAGIMTSSKLEAAEAINLFFIEKVDKLQETALSNPAAGAYVCQDAPDVLQEVPNLPQEVPNVPQEVPNVHERLAKKTKKNLNAFAFSFATAAKIAKIVKDLNNTEACGVYCL
jgi:hypothetical protein